tara:strand:- start:2236 stop:2832 length:597 start_codon:yes stop_codon:yes gene_type:complete
MIIGIDFDNTIIKYDNLFYEIALEKKLIPKNLQKKKEEVKNFFINNNIENQWTILQGEVYGSKIFRAKPFKGFIESIKYLNELSIPFFIISHKTKFPYLGEKVDLHESALNWMASNKFFDADGLNMSISQVYFEPTKERKAKKIVDKGCTHFIDDLPEILDIISDEVKKIFFSPNTSANNVNNWIVMNSWKELPSTLK